jgi:tRNA A-37 threonylcarbamoyl transferase component Bud32
MLSVLKQWIASVWRWLIACLQRLGLAVARSPEAGLKALAPPSLLGRYRLGEPFARGGHGRLYLASADSEGERYVVKAARDDSGSRIAEQAIAHEADVLALLRGHGVPILRDAGVDAWFGRYLVMDLIEGGQLGLFFPNADGLSWLRLMRRLSARLAYLHQRGVAHNDLRFENVLVDAHDRPWLIDFAAARLAITDDPAASSVFAEACGYDVAQLRDWVSRTPVRGLTRRQTGRLKRLNEHPQFHTGTAAEMVAQLSRIEQGRWLRGERRMQIRQRIILVLMSGAGGLLAVALLWQFLAWR